MPNEIQSFADAFAILEDAIAQESQPELIELVQEEWSQEQADWVVRWNELSALGLGHVIDVKNHVRDHVKRHPEAYLAGAAMVSIAIGAFWLRNNAQAETRSHIETHRHSPRGAS